MDKGTEERFKIRPIGENCLMDAYRYMRKRIKEYIVKEGQKLHIGDKDGFRSIMRKSLHFESSFYQEILMEIAVLCEESSFTDFVGELTDFTVLLNSMSPIVQDFINNSFYKSVYTKRIESIDWKKGRQRLVFASST